MKILVTGANGFVGKNLIVELKNRGYTDILKCTRETTREQLDEYTKKCEFVFHLAGVNRPKEEKEFMEGNFGFTSELLGLLKRITISHQYYLLHPFKLKKIILMEEVKRQEKIYFLSIVKKQGLKFMYIGLQIYLENGVGQTTTR